MKNVTLIALSVVAVVVIAGGAGLLSQRHTATSLTPNKPTTTPLSTSASAVSTDTVTLQNFAFVPTSITVKTGTKVTWTNTDAAKHTVMSDMSGMGPESPLFGRDATYSYVFTAPGTYTYHCTPHPYMHGTVIVTE